MQLLSTFFTKIYGETSVRPGYPDALPLSGRNHTESYSLLMLNLWSGNVDSVWRDNIVTLRERSGS